ncbi:putative acyltransferase [Gordonia araii NBRC 100433]|uniref:Putative acyltransferase n=1 Tax=Gordonia araii NBRC 100433 TaxID=1073574 RepID=G7H2R2_9ACTN|nr:acyltransferase family protein [Gordonia araii]NNG98537.1 acyltransferase [Gordonia araii NBRC 100433]GAB10137.1 putative acyltransferase [Gordonia araii NBRC 100433]
MVEPRSKLSNEPPTKATDSKPPALPYRSDLDGLRGVAILLVACFHVWFGRVSGGVDVFLTLSGYFFVGSLLRHTIAVQSPRATYRDAGNPWPRLKRLLKRLLPALYAVLIGVALLTVVVIPESRWSNIGNELIASALYYQNWFLGFNSQDYLAASSANSPLQHIWSMSVQGQFFLVVLILALLTAVLLKLVAHPLARMGTERSVRIIVGVLVLGLAAVSFYWAAMRHGVDQPFNYYDTFARAWEPLAGGLLAVWMPRMRVPNWFRNVVGLVALGLILSCGWWIDGVKEYPGPMALVPVGATVALIWVGATALSKPLPDGSVQPQPQVSRLLATPQGIWLGNIAYSLYLIHWPLLIFYLTWRDKDHANVVEGTAILLTSVLLAWLCKRYIEDPVRYSRRPEPLLRDPKPAPNVTRRPSRWRRAILSYGSVVTVLLVLGVAAAGVSTRLWERHVAAQEVDTSTLDPHRYPGARALLDGWPVPKADPQPAPYLADRDYPETSTDAKMANFEDPNITVGVYGDVNAKRTIALAGGSHSEMWITALNLLGKRHGFRVTTYLKMGCPLSTERVPKISGTERDYPLCYDWGQRVIARIIADRPDAVMMPTTRPRERAPGDWMPDSYKPVFERFMEAGIAMIGIRDTPWPRDRAGNGFVTPDCLSDGGDAVSCGTRRASALSPTDPAIPFAQAHPRMFYRLDLTDGICEPEICPAIVGNIVVYKDYHHLSATYVRSLTDELGRQLQQIPWIGKR